MTTAFTPEPDPANPAAPQSNPLTGAPLRPAAKPAVNIPPAGPDHHDGTGPGPGGKPPADQASPPGPTDPKVAPGPDGPPSTDPGGHPGGIDPAGGDPQTYTSTEPGFPIGQLISGLIQPPLSAAMSLPQMAMALPSMAMGIAGPLLSSMLALLGQQQRHPAPAKHTPAPPSPGPDPITQSRGPAMDAYHDQNERLDKAGTDVKDRDQDQGGLVDQGHDLHDRSTGQIRLIASRINDAAARTPPGPEGAMGLQTQIRAGIAEAREVISSAGTDYQQLASQMAII